MDYQTNSYGGSAFGDSKSLFSKALTEAIGEVRVLEFIPAFEQTMGCDSLTIKHQSLAHFSE